MHTLHNLLVGQGWVAPLDFWKLSPGQVWWIIDAKTPEKTKTHGRDMAEVRRMVKAAKSKEAARNG